MKERMLFLYRLCMSDTATQEQRNELLDLMRMPENSIVAKQLLMNSLLEDNEKVSVDQETTAAIIQAIMQSDTAGKPFVKTKISDDIQPAYSRRHFLGAPWIRYAAAAVIMACTITLFLLKSKDDNAEGQTAEVTIPATNDVPPGRNRATLTLADGTKILLDSASNGRLAAQGGTQVVKLANGNLTYVSIEDNAKPVYHTMATPRGGQYQLRLPDGSQVWLNAASSITYPTSFKGKERKVTMTGEGYFEIAKNAQQPFIVEVNGATVSVTGTHFNINAYNEEASLKTTLLEGSVQVSKGNAMKALRPGQQAQIKADGAIDVLKEVDTEEVIAWKNGYFHFTDADMPTVMKQLERWYDIEVTYEGEIPERSFGGGIQRSLPLSKVLTILEENEVKFEIEGRKIRVLK